MPDYAKRINRLWAESGMSKSELAKKARIEHGTLRAILSGGTGYSREGTLRGLAQAFGLTLGEMTSEAEPKLPANRKTSFAPKEPPDDGWTLGPAPSALPTEGSIEIRVQVPPDIYDILSAIAAVKRSTHQRVAEEALTASAASWAASPDVSALLDAIDNIRRDTEHPPND